MPFIVGVGGGPCSRKMFLCESIKKRFEQIQCENNSASQDVQLKKVVILSQECFYKKLDQHQMELIKNNEFNFDHPEAFDTELFLKTLTSIKNNENVIINEINLKTHLTSNQYEIVSSEVDLVLVEGILVLKHECIRDLLDLKIFILSDSETSLCTRVLRDNQDMKRSLETTLNYYHKFAKPSYEDFCLPTKKYADVMLNAHNIDVATDVVFEHLFDALHKEDHLDTNIQQLIQKKIYRNKPTSNNVTRVMPYN
uniref:Uridine-cytidine kinase 2 n=1 Tax=Salmo salar TaxID=8030 RepID=B5X6V7_SALSA|nr:uridine-cytidine kinase 2 [Salmo salar]ACI66577.1 Uridine-cytidine kinase 2 [Salmo salar]